MSAGYKLSLQVFGIGTDQVQFQNVSADHDTDELDTSSSLNDDGSFNEGFSDADGDISTLSVEVDSILKDVRAYSLLTLFVGGYRYPSVTYALDYNNVSFVTGTGIYIRHNRMTFNIPGAARIRMAFRSLQTGYDIPGA